MVPHCSDGGISPFGIFQEHIWAKDKGRVHERDMTVLHKDFIVVSLMLRAG